MASPRVTALAVAVALAAVLAGCAPESNGSATQTPDASPSGSPTPIPTVSGSPTPTGVPVAIPDDCRAILNEAVLAELAGIPLNDPAFGPSGPQSDGSLICIWADPGADTTGLTTTIAYMSRGPALDLLNQLADDEGFTCYTPDGGTRCEKTWENETYPVTDGRTLFWRDDVLIDTTYSNLAPSGYTTAIVEALFG